MSWGAFPESTLVLKLARVVAYYPGYNYYDIVLAEGGGLYKAVDGRGGNPVIGVRQTFTAPPGTLVIVAMPDSPRGTGPANEVLAILGVLTTYSVTQAEGKNDASDIISGAGVCFDKLAYHTTFDKATTYSPVTAGRGAPSDAVSGEHAETSPLGPAWFMGLAMAYMRASDRCGVWMYRLDEHLRMVAKSLESQTLSREVLEAYDEGELSVIERVAFVPWEALGAFEKNIAIGKASNQDFSPGKIPTQAPIVPVEVNQRSIFRLQTFKGYLGDLQQTFVTAPYQATGVDAFGTNVDKHVGLFRQALGADGALVIQSAKGIHLERYPLIPVPLAEKTYDDPQGDNASNYKASGVFGSGPEQTRGDYQPTGEHPALNAALGLDFHGLQIMQQSLQTLRSHARDYTVQSESTAPLKAALGKGTIDPEGGYKLYPKGAMWMPRGRRVRLPIQSGRWENVSYYNGRSALDLWDDGSLSMEDAWGSQIVMAGGNMILSPPGDIILAPGRNVVLMAPQDVVVKAGNSVDLTASRRDVRLKAERNLMAIGGNSGRGGVLLESRDSGGSYDFEQPGEKSDVQGLVLKNDSGVFSVLSKQASLATTGDFAIQARGRAAVNGQDIQLDGVAGLTISIGDANAQRTTPSDQVTSYSFSTTKATFGTDRAAALYLNGQAYVNGGLSTLGEVFSGGALTVNGGVSASGAVSAASTTITPVGQAGAQAIQNLRRTIFSGTFKPALLVVSRAVAVTRGYLKDLYNGARSYFNAVQASTEAKASLRSTEDYGTLLQEGFLFFEMRWQQYAKAAGVGRRWQEQAVKATKGETYPWPGQEAWTGLRFGVFTMTSFDVTTGVSTGEATPAVNQYKSMAGDYITNSAEE